MTNTKADAFFWTEGDGHRYCVVVLERTRYEWRWNGRARVRQLVVREYHSNSVGHLRRLARRDGYDLGPRVKANCFAKPPHLGCCRWRAPRKAKRALHGAA